MKGEQNVRFEPFAFEQTLSVRWGDRNGIWNVSGRLCARRVFQSLTKGLVQAGSGMWGQGIYFGDAASYSHKSYKYSVPGSKFKQMFVAKVVVGDFKDFGRKGQSNLRRPPEKQKYKVPCQPKLISSALMCWAIA